MITLEKVRIYQKFDGDSDGFSRGSKQSERDPVTDEDCRLIDEIVQNLSIVQAGLASPDFEIRIRKQVSEMVQDELARDYSFRLSKPRT